MIAANAEAAEREGRTRGKSILPRSLSVVVGPNELPQTNRLRDRTRQFWRVDQYYPFCALVTRAA